jgi:hypothetical protein
LGGTNLAFGILALFSFSHFLSQFYSAGNTCELEPIRLRRKQTLGGAGLPGGREAGELTM